VEAEQYDIMAEAEERHWWYLGLRDALRRTLACPALRLPDNPSVLDTGCGTGANLRFLSELLQPSYLAGFDLNERALQFARQKCPLADVYLSDICQPVLHRTGFDLILSCDVLYVPGIANAFAGLEQLVALLKPGGLLILGLPAYEWLKSDHDRVVHTRERYSLSQAQKLLDDLQLDTVRMTYRLSSLLPLVILKRLPALVGWRRKQSQERQSELQQPSGMVNRLLLLNLQLENRLIARGIRLPFGSSILCVGRKRPAFTSKPAKETD
jgi:SAM-dependent methyltransferase